jgi:hypothetical protein
MSSGFRSAKGSTRMPTDWLSSTAAAAVGEPLYVASTRPSCRGQSAGQVRETHFDAVVDGEIHGGQGGIREQYGEFVSAEIVADFFTGQVLIL